MTKKLLETVMFLSVSLFGLWGTYLFYPVAAVIVAPFSGGQWLVGMITLLAVAYAIWMTIATMAVCSGAYAGGFYLGMTSPLSLETLLAQIDGKNVKENPYGY